MSKLYDLLSSVVVKLNKTIKTEAQTLTEEQKTQVRANIGAMSENYTPPIPTAEQVGADTKGSADAAVSTHNASADAHGDIRTLISELSNKLNALADSDDTTLDQMSEVVAYIKANKTLIESITTSKVNVSDIIDNLTTSVSNKPLSAKQGVVLKELIDANTSDIGEISTALDSIISEQEAIIAIQNSLIGGGSV